MINDGVIMIIMNKIKQIEMAVMHAKLQMKT